MRKVVLKYLLFFALVIILFSLAGCKEKYKLSIAKEITVQQGAGEPITELTGAVPRKAAVQQPTAVQQPATTQEPTVSETDSFKKTKEGGDFTAVDSALTLKDYPQFLKGKKVKIVVGEMAPALDVVTATSIQMKLNDQGINVETILAKEAQKYPAADLIVLGQPCVNPLVNEVLGSNANDCNSLAKNTARIVLLTLDKKEIIVVAGAASQDVQKAAALLTNSGGALILGKKLTLSTVGSAAITGYN